MTPDQEKEIQALIAYFRNKAMLPNQIGRRADRAVSSLLTLVAERDSLLAFKASVDEALNSGDGSYKP